MKMRDPWLGNKLTKSMDNKGYIWPGKSKIKQLANKSLILRIVRKKIPINNIKR